VGEADCRIIICDCRQQGGVLGADMCGVSEALSFKVSTAMKVYIVIWGRALCSLMGGYQHGSCRQLCYSEMLGDLM
jgi:hypothetical protein